MEEVWRQTGDNCAIKITTGMVNKIVLAAVDPVPLKAVEEYKSYFDQSWTVTKIF